NAGRGFGVSAPAASFTTATGEDDARDVAMAPAAMPIAERRLIAVLGIEFSLRWRENSRIWKPACDGHHSKWPCFLSRWRDQLQIISRRLLPRDHRSAIVRCSGRRTLSTT